MAFPLPRVLRELTTPRSRRSQLWACVYCGAFGTAADDAEDSPDSG